MPALNYSYPPKIPKVESGECRQTIRRMRKRPFKVGDRLYHYHGMRTKKCRKLGESDCTEALPITRLSPYNWRVKGFPVTASAYVELMERDGFEQASDFEDFFDRYPDGEVLQIIRWEEIEKP